MFNIAMVSRWHPHGMENRYPNQLKNIDGVKITCVWDSDVERGKKWAVELGADFEENLETMLKRDDVDGICITAPTDEHKDIILKAAAAGKHVFSEKPLGMNYEEAIIIEKAAKEAGIEVGVVFPRRANREYYYAKKLIDNGEFGDICLVHVRNAVTVNAVFEDHWFKAEPIGGGGAVRDLGCHNIDLACWLLGEPEEINTTVGFRRGFAVDDTGVCNIKFKNGAIAMVDSTFSAPLCQNWYNLEIYGTEKAFIANTEEVIIINKDETKEILKISEMEEGNPLPIEQWILKCTGKGENYCNLEAGVLVNRVLDAAVKAQKEKRTVTI